MAKRRLVLPSGELEAFGLQARENLPRHESRQVWRQAVLHRRQPALGALPRLGVDAQQQLGLELLASAKGHGRDERPGRVSDFLAGLGVRVAELQRSACWDPRFGP
jgi:hypothetical protein